MGRCSLNVCKISTAYHNACCTATALHNCMCTITLLTWCAKATGTTIAGFCAASGSADRGQDAVLDGLARAGKDRLEDQGHKLHPSCNKRVKNIAVAIIDAQICPTYVP